MTLSVTKSWTVVEVVMAYYCSFGHICVRRGFLYDISKDQ